MIGVSYLFVRYSALLLGLLVLISSCEQNNNTNKGVPSARELKDSALKLAMLANADSSDKAVKLLNDATELDTNYYSGYWNKLSLQISLGKYVDANGTINQLIRLKPFNPGFRVTAALIDFKLNQTEKAVEDLDKAIVLYDHILDTMTTGRMEFNYLNAGKSIVFLLKRDQNKAKMIFESIPVNDSVCRDIVIPLMDLDRNEIVERLLNPLDSRASVEVTNN